MSEQSIKAGELLELISIAAALRGTFTVEENLFLATIHQNGIVRAGRDFTLEEALEAYSKVEVKKPREPRFFVKFLLDQQFVEPVTYRVVNLVLPNAVKITSEVSVMDAVGEL